MDAMQNGALALILWTCVLQGNSSSQFDPFGIADSGASGQGADAGHEHGPPPLKFEAFEDDFEEDATTPLAATGGKAPHKLVKACP